MREADAVAGEARGDGGLRVGYPGPAPTAPPGLVALLEGLTREVLKANPTDIYPFCAQHFEKLLAIRDAHEGKKIKPKMTLEQKIEHVQKKIREKAEKRYNTLMNETSKINTSLDETESNDTKTKELLVKSKTSAFNIETENKQIQPKDEIQVIGDGQLVKDETKEEEKYDRIGNMLLLGTQGNMKDDHEVNSITKLVPIEAKSKLNLSLAKTSAEDGAVSEVKLETINKNMVPEAIRNDSGLIINSFEAKMVGQASTNANGKEENLEHLGDVDTNYASNLQQPKISLNIIELKHKIGDINSEKLLECNSSDVNIVEIKEKQSEIKELNEDVNSKIQESSIEVNESDVLANIKETSDEQTQNLSKRDNSSEIKINIESTKESIVNEEIEGQASQTDPIATTELKQSKEPEKDSSVFVMDTTCNEIVKDGKQNMGKEYFEDACNHTNEKDKSSSVDHSVAKLESNVSDTSNSKAEAIQDATITENKCHKDEKEDTILDSAKGFEQHESNNDANENNNENQTGEHYHEGENNLDKKNIAQNITDVSTQSSNSNDTVQNDKAKLAADIVDSGIQLMIAGNSTKHNRSIDSDSESKEIEGFYFNESNLDQMENEKLQKSDQEIISPILNSNFCDINEIVSDEQVIQKTIDTNDPQQDLNVFNSSENENVDVKHPIGNSISMDLETAAITIQKVFRAFLFKSRTSTSEENTNDGNSIEMSEASYKTSDSEAEHFTKSTGDDILGMEEKSPGVLVRMNTVLQTVNEEKSLSLSTDESLSSAATVIQAHVRGFLVRNRLNSNKLRSSDTTGGSDETLNMDTPRATSAKTVLNINIREQENFVSTGDSLDTSVDLPIDPGVYAVNLHPLGYDKDARKRLIREDAIQSMSPPSNSSFNSPKEMSIEQTETKTLVTSNSQLDNNKENIIKEDAGQGVEEMKNELEEMEKKEINTTQHDKLGTKTGIVLHSDEMDVVTPFHNENSEPSKMVSDEKPGLLHSSEFHDLVLPTRVVRNDSTIVREFKSVLVFFIVWHGTA